MSAPSSPSTIGRSVRQDAELLASSTNLLVKPTCVSPTSLRPLEDTSVDATTVGQAFHWFDGDRALTEIHRIARRGSRLAVVYNRRVLDDPLQAALEAVLQPLRGEAPAHRSGQWRDAFKRTRVWMPVEEFEVAHVQLLDHEGVVARVASTSFIAGLAADRRADVLDRIRALVKDHSEPIALPYVCELFVWRRLP